MSSWSKFTARFPNAKFAKFSKSYDNVQYNMGNGNSVNVFNSTGQFHSSIYFPEVMTVDLGIAGFPFELTLNRDPTLAVLAVQFSESPHSLGDIKQIG